MAAVSHAPSELLYSRRVSFNNLLPEDLEAAGPDHSRFYSYSMAPKKDSADPEMSKLLGSYSFVPLLPGSRKRLKLPDPPLKLILKNKLSAAQLYLNLSHAVLAGAMLQDDLNDLVNNPPSYVPRLELARVVQSSENAAELEDSASESDQDDFSPPPPPSGRRKLYSGMTDEELMALDPQFAKPKTSDVNSFKFDSVSYTYSSTPKKSAAAAIASAKQKQVIYPSLNENNYKSVSLTMKHQDFDQESLYPRTLLTVISGRRHTWNSLDWLLLTEASLQGIPSFLQDGDHLVVAGLVPLKFLTSDSKSVPRKKNSPEAKIQQKCESILQYIVSHLPDNLIRLKITVELIMDVPPPDPMALTTASARRAAKTGTKFMLTHLFKQYQPMLVCVGNRSTSLNFKYPRKLKNLVSGYRSSRSSVSGTPTRASISGTSSSGMKSTEMEADEYLVKLSSYLVRYSTVPVIMVGNSTVFHKKVKRKQLTSVTFLNPQSLLNNGTKRKNLESSESSIESYNLPNEQGSGSSTDASGDYNLSEELLRISHGSSETRYSAMLLAISTTSLTQLRDYLEKIKNDKLDAHDIRSKVHEAYVSMERGRNNLLKTNSSGTATKAYKVKSLICYDEEEEKSQKKMMDEKKLKKSVSRSSAGSSILGTPDDKKVKKKKSFLQKMGLKK